MKRHIFKEFFLLSLWFNSAQAQEIPDVSLRFHAQWDVGDEERQRLQEKYGAVRVSFDEGGHAVPVGLLPEHLKRWVRLYELCMRDGCYYCDADEGSCELGTCGPTNAYCKPYMGDEGYPQCGIACADYAFTSVLSQI